MKFDKELLKGNSTLIVLKCLERNVKYGYQIIKDLEILSNNIFQFKEGTLYPILHSLENGGYIKSFWEDTDSKRKRKYYHITPKGLELLSEKEEQWRIFTMGMNNILNERIILMIVYNKLLVVLS